MVEETFSVRPITACSMQIQLVFRIVEDKPGICAQQIGLVGQIVQIRQKELVVQFHLVNRMVAFRDADEWSAFRRGSRGQYSRVRVRRLIGLAWTS